METTRKRDDRTSRQTFGAIRLTSTYAILERISWPINKEVNRNTRIVDDCGPVPMANCESLVWKNGKYYRLTVNEDAGSTLMDTRGVVVWIHPNFRVSKSSRHILLVQSWTFKNPQTIVLRVTSEHLTWSAWEKGLSLTLYCSRDKTTVERKKMRSRSSNAFKTKPEQVWKRFLFD